MKIINDIEVWDELEGPQNFRTKVTPKVFPVIAWVKYEPWRKKGEDIFIAYYHVIPKATKCIQ